MLWNRKHDILDLPQIPRERNALQELINSARRRRKIKRLMNWTSINLMSWAVIIVTVWMPMQRAGAAPVPVSVRTYLPVTSK